MRLIDADALIEKCGEWYVEEGTEEGFIGTVKQLIDAQPERSPGKWRRRLVDSGFNADWHCSECGWKTSLEEHGYNFCPNCGADMRGERDG